MHKQHDKLAGATVETAKTAFDAALKARNNAAVALLNAGGIKYEETIAALDKNAGLISVVIQEIISKNIKTLVLVQLNMAQKQ